jgi:hypothetical protein
MNNRHEPSFHSILPGFITVILMACTVIPVPSHANTMTVNPEMSLDSGDYGSGDTITTYSMSITGSYNFASKWTLSLTAVPYIHQNETYTDVVLVHGRPVHHEDPTGLNPHHPDTHPQLPQLPQALTPTDMLPSSATTPRDYITNLPQPSSQVQVPAEAASKIPSSSIPVPSLTKAGQSADKSTVSTQGTSNAATSTTPSAATQTKTVAGEEYIEQQIKRHGSASGVGDCFVNLSYQILAQDETKPELSLHGGIKLPTADEDKGLGTGEVDYLVGLGLSKEMVGWFFFGGLDYNILGDPDYYELDNYISGYLGAGTPILPMLGMNLQLTYAQAPTDFSDDSLALRLDLNYYLEKLGTLTAGLQKGLSDGSPDYSVIIGYSISF